MCEPEVQIATSYFPYTETEATNGEAFTNRHLLLRLTQVTVHGADTIA
jgi:hypothetical protein